jgi:hypothetical protein
MAFLRSSGVYATLASGSGLRRRILCLTLGTGPRFFLRGIYISYDLHGITWARELEAGKHAPTINSGDV